MTDTDLNPGSYTCRWCNHTSSGRQLSCPSCGASTDIRKVTTDRAGWTELPPIPDMAKIQFGQSSAQVAGTFVPTVDMKLAQGDGVYFSHHVLLWQEPGVQLAPMPMKGAWKRMRAGMDLFMLQATGPGHLAFSDDSPGEVLAVPLQPGQAVDVVENKFLVATSPVTYDWIDSGIWFTTSGSGAGGGGSKWKTGLKVIGTGMELLDMFSGEGDVDLGGDNETEWHYPCGKYIDRFSSGSVPGLLFIHAAGNSFIRYLAAQESILIKPPALLYKDPTVNMQLHVEYPQAGVKFWRSWGNRYLWLRLWGPGRVAIQSSYEKLEDPGGSFQSTSGHTEY
ncbi:MAG: AIM24 family protein, partial [Actinomycetota bacterium]|nr:AIM24 family protein [Actinomycetota bacterium]